MTEVLRIALFTIFCVAVGWLAQIALRELRRGVYEVRLSILRRRDRKRLAAYEPEIADLRRYEPLWED